MVLAADQLFLIIKLVYKLNKFFSFFEKLVKITAETSTSQKIS